MAYKGPSTMTLDDMKAVASFGETLEELAKQDIFHADYKEEAS